MGYKHVLFIQTYPIEYPWYGAQGEHNIKLQIQVTHLIPCIHLWFYPYFLEGIGLMEIELPLL